MAVSDGQTSVNQDDTVILVPANLRRRELEALGVVVLDDLPADKRERESSFVRIRIPEGWSLHKSRYIGVQDIVDERGVKRITTNDNGQWWDRYVSTVVVHQGSEVPLRLLYGDGDLDSVLWDRFTDEEKEEAKQGLLKYASREYIGSSAETSAKAQEWLDTIDALP